MITEYLHTRPLRGILIVCLQLLHHYNNLCGRHAFANDMQGGAEKLVCPCSSVQINDDVMHRSSKVSTN